MDGFGKEDSFGQLTLVDDLLFDCVRRSVESTLLAFTVEY